MMRATAIVVIRGWLFSSVSGRASVVATTNACNCFPCLAKACGPELDRYRGHLVKRVAREGCSPSWSLVILLRAGGGWADCQCIG
ncbi:uncharacterized protein EI90DRAFT_3044658 [Cantharellus anzutake]|uniref:uncharacterized protein n=1 Tax=Cantharellus anzutake TaxID=1750568 RepID=UPI00190380F8|nr:uncharacterized protein EI90DRAFT_3044658 [Cantharellus anzutake]KAF8337036.1 hypothetical protein EI90DRAFT_3044658 [Cantharellus anzutake]